MRIIEFEQGNELADKTEPNKTLYMVKEGNLKITSVDNQKFVLGLDDYIGSKARMGTGRKKPGVNYLEALDLLFCVT